MTLPRFDWLIGYWKEFSPTHISAAALKNAYTTPKGNKKRERSEDDGDDYEPPTFEGTNDLTHVLGSASAFGDAFEPMKMRTVEIDNTKKPEPPK